MCLGAAVVPKRLQWLNGYPVKFVHFQAKVWSSLVLRVFLIRSNVTSDELPCHWSLACVDSFAVFYIRCVTAIATTGTAKINHYFIKFFSGSISWKVSYSCMGIRYFLYIGSRRSTWTLISNYSQMQNDKFICQMIIHHLRKISFTTNNLKLFTFHLKSVDLLHESPHCQ